MQTTGEITRILIVDSDEKTFAIRQCIAQALQELPPIELFHARDATEALALLDSLAPDVIVLDDEEPAERDLFIDSLSINHPPIVLCTEQHTVEVETTKSDNQITYIPRSETLEGFHQTLMVAAAIGLKFTSAKDSRVVH